MRVAMDGSGGRRWRWQLYLTSMRLAMVAVATGCMLFFSDVDDASAQQAPASTPVRTVLELTNLPSVIDAPLFFKLSRIELGAGTATNYSGPIGFVYVSSGSLISQAD